MQDKVLDVVNEIRMNKGESKLDSLKEDDKFREDLGLDSFDLAELTVRLEAIFDVDVFENGLIDTIGELFVKLKK